MRRLFLTRKDVSPEKNTLNNIEKSIMSMAASRKTKGQQCDVATNQPLGLSKLETWKL